VRLGLSFGFTLALFALANDMLSTQFRSTPVAALPPKYWDDMMWLVLLGLVYSIVGDQFTGVRQGKRLLQVQVVVGACVLAGVGLLAVVSTLDGSRLLLLVLGLYLLVDGVIKLRLRQGKANDVPNRSYQGPFRGR